MVLEGELRAVRDAEGGERPTALQDWQMMFASIYDAHNALSYPNDAEIMLRLHEEVSMCLESLRKERFHEITERLPNIFAWFMAFTRRMSINLSAVAWHKYPGVCPDCRAETHCQCIACDAAYEPHDHDLTPRRRDVGKMPRSLEDWQALHARIYGRINDKLQSRAQVFFHLAEEVGELGKEFRLQNRENMEAEAADVFLWILANANKLGVSLADMMWRRYPHECDTCHAQKCVCEKI